jgi:competence protein ComFC
MIEVIGPWKKGFAFDIHTLSSTYLGDNEYGHARFDTKRTPMGQCIYELKYGQHLNVLDNIKQLLLADKQLAEFINKIDVILPIPPSNKYREIQPVLVCSEKLCEIYKKELMVDVLASANKEELKNTSTEEKYEKIKSCITINKTLEKMKKILIFDDVFDSGSTLTAFANAFIERGYENIYVFTLTKTRKAD